MYVLASHRKRRSTSGQTCKHSKQAGEDQSVTASDGGQAPHAIVTKSQQPSGAEPVGLPHLHLTPTHALTSAHNVLHRQAYSYADSIPACGSVSGIHTGASVCSMPALHTQTVMHPDAEESDLTVALRDLQRNQVHQQQQQPVPASQRDASQAVQSAHGPAMGLQHTVTCVSEHEQPALNLQSQPILQCNLSGAAVNTGGRLVQAANSQQQAFAKGNEMLEPTQLHYKHGGVQSGKSQHQQHGTQAQATVVLGIKANGIHSLTEAQVLMSCT